jgi:hypothetical protein
MKKELLLLVAVLPLLITSCVGAPTTLEEALFNITTTEVPIVSTTTNVVGGVEVVTSETNWVEAFDFTPNEKSTAIVETGTNIGNFFGVGGIVGTLLSALLGIWAKSRSNSNRKTAAILAQVIEAGRKVMSTTPQGAQLESQWTAWMMKHQTEAGVILEVSKLLKQVVDKESAQMVADTLIGLSQAKAPNPVSKK